MSRYQWFVFLVAALGWLADCMDQQLFVLARPDAVADLLGPELATPGRIKEWSGNAISIFLIGWATGGLAFGILGDRWGRVRTMLLTILLYSFFTGLSSFALNVYDFCFYRFLTGLGVGGEFAVGVALLAEVMPDRARPFTLGLLQAFSGIGNISAALIYIAMVKLEMAGTFEHWYLGSWHMNGWRLTFLVGIVPALLALLVRRRLQEPERWKAAAASDGKKLGSYVELFRDPRWRRHALLGMGLAFAGVVGLWGIGFFSVDLVKNVLREAFAAEGLKGKELDGASRTWGGINSVVLNLGASMGIFAFSWMTHYTGRRLAFAVGFVLSAASTAVVFLFFKQRSDIFWMIPLMGFFQLSVFGGYAIYFPELFPTRLRSTGTSFCYNIGRFVAAVGPMGLALLSTNVFNNEAQPYRLAGVTMCSVFLIGLAVLPFLPETQGKPLPE